MTARAFGDLVAELDMYALVRSRVLSRGRYGRTREITLDLTEEVIEKLYATARMSFDLRG
jgi:cell division control protein 6